MSHRIQATASITLLFHKYKQTHLPTVCKYILTGINKQASNFRLASRHFHMMLAAYTTGEPGDHRAEIFQRAEKTLRT